MIFEIIFIWAVSIFNKFFEIYCNLPFFIYTGGISLLEVFTRFLIEFMFVAYKLMKPDLASVLFAGMIAVIILEYNIFYGGK